MKRLAALETLERCTLAALGFLVETCKAELDASGAIERPSSEEARAAWERALNNPGQMALLIENLGADFPAFADQMLGRLPVRVRTQTGGRPQGGG